MRKAAMYLVVLISLLTGENSPGADLYTDSYVYHNGDLDTYLYFSDDYASIRAGNVQFITISEAPSDDWLKFADGNDVDIYFHDDNLFIDGGNGRVGVGTAAPYTKLQVEESGDDDPFRVSVSGETYFIVENEGNVGIGTADPEYALDVHPSSTNTIQRIKSDNGYAGLFIDRHLSTSNGYVVFETGGLADWCVGEIGAGSANWDFAISTQYSQADGTFYLTHGDGFLGLGTTSPARQLHLRGNNAAFRMDRDVNSAAFMLVRTAAGDFNTVWKTFVVGTRASGVNNGEFIIDDLGTAVGGDGARRLTIANNGNIGIGTSSPAQKLSVQGNVIANAYLYNSSRELKREIAPLTAAECARLLGELEKTDVCRYQLKSAGASGALQLGMIAEDAPEEIRSPDGKSISLTDTVGMLLASVKAQSDLIKAQSEKIAWLESEMSSLQERLAK